MVSLGKIEAVPLREVWPDEAKHFTPWMATDEGLELLGNTIGVELELLGTEKSVGRFKADIVAKVISQDDDENIVIVENQLNQTDHDHLGKVITYAAGHKAKIVVWIARKFTDEHRQAIEWINQNSTEDISYFALEITLLKIGASAPAAEFNIVSRPNEWAKAVRASQAKEFSEVKLDQLKFWEELIEHSEELPEAALRLSRKPRPQHWYNIAIGRSGFRLTLTVNSVLQRVGCEIYIYDDNAKSYFDLLILKKEEIENELGYKLEWQELEDKKGSRIAIYESGLYEREEERQELIAWLYEKGVEFSNAFGPIIQNLDK